MKQIGYIRIGLMAMLLTVSQSSGKGDALEEVTAALVGPNAMDCGVSSFNGSREKVDKCVVAAFRSGSEFRARYNTMGYDSALAEGVIRTMSGRIYFAKYDSDEGGGAGMGSSVYLWMCPKTEIVFVEKSERLVCPAHKGNW